MNNSFPQHPFDTLSDYDTSADLWQGRAFLACAFGSCKLVIKEDAEAIHCGDHMDDPAEYRPYECQRCLYDFFEKKQTALRPALRDCILDCLHRIADYSVPAQMGFPKLANYLENPCLYIASTSVRGIGELYLVFDIKGTQLCFGPDAKDALVVAKCPNSTERNASLCVQFHGDPPKKSLRICSCSFLSPLRSAMIPHIFSSSTLYELHQSLG